MVMNIMPECPDDTPSKCDCVKHDGCISSDATEGK